MSMARCTNCNNLVDTDFDLEFYPDELCEYCAEVLAKDQAEDERLDDPRHGQAAEINRSR